MQISKLVLIKVSLIGLPFVVLILFLEYQAIELNSIYPRQNKFISNKLGSIEVLVLGSSHANYSINPEFISRPSFNLSSPAQDLYYDYKLFEKYSDSLKNLKYLLLSLSYFSLNYEIKSNYSKFYYLKSYEIPAKHNFIYRGSLQNISFVANLGLERIINSLNTGKYSEMDSNGYSTSYKILEEKDSTVMYFEGKRQSKITANVNNAELIDYNYDLLCRFAEICNRKEIKLVLFTTPFTKYYVEGTAQEYKDLLYSRIEKLKEVYNFEYLNFSNDSRFTKEDFSDYDHMNHKGARKFSVLVNEYICRN